MFHPVMLQELAKARQRDILKEAEARRLAARARRSVGTAETGRHFSIHLPHLSLHHRPPMVGGGRVAHMQKP